MPNANELRERIKAARDFRFKAVSVPEWNLDEGLYVRSLSITQALEFEKASQDIEREKYASLYLAYALCDEGGTAIFEPDEGVEELYAKEYAVIHRLFDEAHRLNNGDPEAPDDLPKSSPNPS